MPEKTIDPVVDAIDEEANPPEYPAGSPLLHTIAEIRPRSRRAQFKRLLADFLEKQAAVNLLGLATDTEDMEQAAKVRSWAEMDELYQQMAELMELAAKNPTHCVEWTDNATDEALLAVFQVFMRRAQPGEAPSSTS